MMYSIGQGVNKDHKAAFKWFKLAAEQGNAIAQNRLGFVYYEGQGVTQDYIRAYMWLDISASQGGKKAKGNLKIVKRKMKSTDETKAHQLALDCVAKNYKDC